MTNSAKARRVVVLCFQDAELLDITGPANVLTMASRLRATGGGYQLRLVAKKLGPIRTIGGVELYARARADAVRGRLDTLIVPGGEGITIASAREIVPQLRRLASLSRRVVG